ALEISEVFHEKVAGAILADGEILAPRVDAAEDAREPGDEDVPLADVAPHLILRERARREALEVFGPSKRALREQLRGERFEPLLVRHRGAIISLIQRVSRGRSGHRRVQHQTRLYSL